MTDTFFLKNGARYNVTTDDAVDLRKELPAGTYTVKYDQMAGQFYLEIIEGFDLPGKLYGDTIKQADRILDTFKDRPGSTGAMLSGEKGSGKTLLAKVLSIEAMNQGIPTIVINAPWHGEGFNGFMQMIRQPIVVIFDEFEKVYNNEEQEALLTLLDGVYPSKKLFILTCNDKYKVNTHMKNRPGRVFYRLDYKGLTPEFIREYCADNLKNQEHTEAICRISMTFNEFNFDILKALVEEMNRYNEAPQDAMQMLNAKPDTDERSTYNVTLSVKGKKLPEDFLGDAQWRGNPLASSVMIWYSPDKPIVFSDDDDDDETRIHPKQAMFNPTDLQKVDADTGEFSFLNKEGLLLSLSKVQRAAFEYYGAY